MTWRAMLAALALLGTVPASGLELGQGWQATLVADGEALQVTVTRGAEPPVRSTLPDPEAMGALDQGWQDLNGDGLLDLWYWTPDGQDRQLHLFLFRPSRGRFEHVEPPVGYPVERSDPQGWWNGELLPESGRVIGRFRGRELAGLGPLATHQLLEWQLTEGAPLLRRAIRPALQQEDRALWSRLWPAPLVEQHFDEDGGLVASRPLQVQDDRPVPAALVIPATAQALYRHPDRSGEVIRMLSPEERWTLVAAEPDQWLRVAHGGEEGHLFLPDLVAALLEQLPPAPVLAVAEPDRWLVTGVDRPRRPSDLTGWVYLEAGPLRWISPPLTWPASTVAWFSVAPGGTVESPWLALGGRARQTLPPLPEARARVTVLLDWGAPPRPRAMAPLTLHWPSAAP